jgi:hypothetical protein
MAFKKWQVKGESFRVDSTVVTKAKTALKQETYNPSDLKHDLHCGSVELGAGSWWLGLGLIVTNTIDSKTFCLPPDSYITRQLVAHLGTFVLLALERFFSLGPHGPRLRPSNKSDLPVT